MAKYFVYLFLFLCLPILDDAQALDYLNSFRQRAGLISFRYNSYLTLAAQKHSEYMQANKTLTHIEKPFKPKFYAQRPAEKAIRAGYNNRFVEEDIAYNESGYKHAVDGLLSVVYHRLSLLSLDHDEAGQGQAGNYYTFLLGNSHICELCRQYKDFHDYMGAYYNQVCADEDIKLPRDKYTAALNSVMSKNKDIVVFPFQGQENVGLYSSEETPNPVPSCHIMGYPVTIAFNPYYHSNIKVLSFKLYDSHNDLVSCILLNSRNDPNHKLKPYQFALIPRHILGWGQTYRAVVKYRDNTGTKTYTWSFTTLSMPGLVEVSGKKKIFLSPGSHDLDVLIVPQSCRDRNFNQVNVNYSTDSFSFSYDNLILLHVHLQGKKGQSATLQFGNGYELSIFIQ